MQIKEVSASTFDEYAFNHPNRSFYQTSNYGSLMSKHGYQANYIALYDNNNNIVAATLLLTQKAFANYKFGYAPRGFLIDFFDIQLVKTFSEYLQKMLYNLGYIYVKVDPPIIYQKHNYDGSIISNSNNNHLINQLYNLGYEHLGFNKYFENMKPRWNAILKIEASSGRIFKSFKKETRNKIRKSFNKGIKIYKASSDDIKDFYNLIDKKHTRKLNYYLDLYETFSKDEMFEIYFAKIDTLSYVEKSKKVYELEEQNNYLINDKFNKNPRNQRLLNQKIESDKLLNNFKNEMIRASNLYSTNPDGIIIGTSAIIKYGKEIFFLIDGIDKKYSSFAPNHLLKWHIIEKYAKEGYMYMNLNGITGDFNKTNKYYGLYLFKRGFNTEVTEYIGEFDFIVNKALYIANKNVKPLKDWFNRPLSI